MNMQEIAKMLFLFDQESPINQEENKQLQYMLHRLRKQCHNGNG
uniref:Uncharacterized protein n=1 Tax=Arundo donax TaxID=35708 RepID=A0A0A9FXH1_ARUDO